jgi:hypothetical protein
LIFFARLVDGIRYGEFDVPFAKNGKSPRSINTVHLPKGKDYNIASKGKPVTIAEDNKYGSDTESIASGMLQSLMNRCFYRSQNLTPKGLRPETHVTRINHLCRVDHAFDLTLKCLVILCSRVLTFSFLVVQLEPPRVSVGAFGARQDRT